MIRALWLTLLLAGCESALPHVPDLAEQPDGATPAGVDGGFPADVTLGSLMPQVTNQNPIGGTIASPKVVAVTWDGDTYRTDVEAFFPDYAKSTAWKEQTGEYGIGAFKVGDPIHLGAAPASFSDPDLQQMLKTNLGGASPAWGPADTSTTYQFFIPPTVAFDDGTGDACCNDYGGYHGDTIVDGIDVTFAVICECASSGPGDDPLEDITVTCGHELVESVTDPYSGTPGYEWPSNTYFGWLIVTTGELADLCEFADTADWKPGDMSYYVQRTWSNEAAAAGHDPCVGDGTTPYYQTIPYMADTLSASIPGFGSFDGIRGIRIAVGDRATVELQAFADAATGPLTVTLADLNADYGGDPLLAFSPSTLTMMPGERAGVQVTVVDTDAADFGSVQPFIVKTKSATGPTTYFYATVGQ